MAAILPIQFLSFLSDLGRSSAERGFARFANIVIALCGRDLPLRVITEICESHRPVRILSSSCLGKVATK